MVYKINPLAYYDVKYKLSIILQSITMKGNGFQEM